MVRADRRAMALLWESDEGVDSDMMDVAPGVWIRNGRRTRAWAATAVLWSSLFASLMFIPGHSAGPTTLGQILGLGAFYLGIAGVGFVLAGRVARAGVWIGPDGIVIRGPFRTHHIDLENGARFVPGLQGRGGNGTPCPMLERPARRAVGVWALGRRNIWFRYERVSQEIQPLCDTLTELIEGLRSVPPSSDPVSS
jgi:hypothetical protein